MPNAEHSKPLRMATASDVTPTSAKAVTCSLCRQAPCRAAAVKTTLKALPQEALRKLWAGKLSQTCPGCGHVEPAGLRCSKCFGAVLPEHWSPNTRKQRRAPENRQTARPGCELEAA
jgi:hypothetical protein